MKDRKNFSMFLMLALAVGIFGVISATNVWAQTASPATSAAINNVVPVFTTDTTESWTQTYTGGASPISRTESSTDFPTYVDGFTAVTFSGTGDDPNDDNYYLIVCDAPSVVTAVNGGAPLCSVGDTNLICKSSSSVADTVEATCSVTAAGAAETVEWYSYLCDDHATDSKCTDISSTSNGGTDDEDDDGSPNLTGSPYHQNHIPVFTANAISDNDPNATITFFNSSDSDTDVNGTADTFSLYVCPGEQDRGGETATFNSFDKTCRDSTNSILTTICSDTGNDSAEDATCNDVTNITSAPMAHRVDYQVYFFVVDSHGFVAAVDGEQFAINDVAPVLAGTTYTEDGSISIGVNSYDDVIISADFTDLNGDNDIVLIDLFEFFEDGAVNEGCVADENTCLKLTSLDLTQGVVPTSAPSTGVEGYYTTTQSDLTDREGTSTEAGSDIAMTVIFHVVPYFNAFPSSSWTAAARISDGSTTNIDLANSAGTMTIGASSGLGVQESAIGYGTVSLGGYSGTEITTIQNLHNTAIDVRVDGTFMALGSYSDGQAGCAASEGCIVQLQQKWEELAAWDGSVSYASANALQITSTTATAAPGCINNNLVIRDKHAPSVCQDGTTPCTTATQGTACSGILGVTCIGDTDEFTGWQILIPSEQGSGSFTGVTTLTSTVEATCN